MFHFILFLQPIWCLLASSRHWRAILIYRRILTNALHRFPEPGSVLITSRYGLEACYPWQHPLTIGNLTVGCADLHAAYQLLYRTNGARHKPSLGRSTLLTPRNANKSCILCYHAAYDSTALLCAPSNGLQYDASSSASQSALGKCAVTSSFLAQSWVLCVPEYE